MPLNEPSHENFLHTPLRVSRRNVRADDMIARSTRQLTVENAKEQNEKEQTKKF